MYTKRQTVWLVSMLSLMVVLSAYYLFTEDANTMNGGETQVTLNEVKVDAKDLTKLAAEEAVKETAAKSASGSVSGEAAAGKAKTDAAATAKAESEVLGKVAAKATSGQDFFASMQMKRTEDLSKQSEKWMTIVTDSKQKTENVSKAYEELNKLQELEAKITSIEEKLMKDFPNALVTQEESRFKVIVQAAKLEKSQAVSIVDMVMNEMNVGPERISVQYVR